MTSYSSDRLLATYCLVAALVAGAITATPSPAHGALISGVTIADFSSELNGGSGLTREAVRLVDGSGLTGSGSAGSTHGVVANDEMWMTHGSGLFLAPDATPDPDPFVTFDLTGGGTVDLGLIRIWNFNEGSGVFGVDDVLIEVSSTSATTGFSSLGTFSLLTGTGAGYIGEEISEGDGTWAVGAAHDIRWVRFDILSSHQGDTFPGIHGVPGFGLVGLSEVRFETFETVVPEPSTLVLFVLGLASLALGRRRRKGR